MTSMVRCRCGSGDSYSACCGRLHLATLPAPTAEALLRSRYSAFARDEVDYLLATWHPSTRPARWDPDANLDWVRLEIVEVAGGGPFDRDGIVEFRAHYRRSGAPVQRGVRHERSTFVRTDGRWCYLGPAPS